MGYGLGLILKTCFVVKRGRIESLKLPFIRMADEERYQTKQCCWFRGLVQGHGKLTRLKRKFAGRRMEAETEDYYNGEFDPGSG